MHAGHNVQERFIIQRELNSLLNRISELKDKLLHMHTEGEDQTLFQLVSQQEKDISDLLERTRVELFADRVQISGKINGQPPGRDKSKLQLPPKTPDFNMITSREEEIIDMIAEGKTSREISSILHISFHTVLSHRKNLLKKLCVHNTAELISLVKSR